MDEPPPPKQLTITTSESCGSLSSFSEDILQHILSRLPALTFASATCVNRSWNRICSRILSRPKMLSALSLNSSLEMAVKEVLNKALCEPIRPYFVIACVGKKFNLERAHKLITARFGSNVPIITSKANGIMGGDAITDEFKEVKWVENQNDESYNSRGNVHRGILLMVGFVPGLKVSVIPLLQPKNDPPQIAMIDKFVTDIREFTSAVSGSTSPVGIIMFADLYADMKPVLEKMNYAMAEETIIVGDEGGCFLYNKGVDYALHDVPQLHSRCNSKTERTSRNFNCDAISLVFASDRGSPDDTGDIHFSLALSTGVSPIGPMYKAASVRVDKGKKFECSTWLTARREESLETLDGQRMLHDIEDLVENDILSDDLYIGVTKRRKYSIGSEKKKSVSSLAFHEILRGDDEYLFVRGDGIKTGDSFCFFRPDPETALVARDNVFKDLRDLKQRNIDKKLVFGGLVFSCYGRGESFFSRTNVDSSAFLDNFHGVPLAGIFCCGEIGRSSSALISEDNQGQSNFTKSFLHVYSSVYLLMWYTPKKN